jgi:predicted amidohydrolase YtcJ
MKRIFFWLAVFLMSTQAMTKGKTLYFNAKIYTGQDIHRGDAFIVSEGRFLKIGPKSMLDSLMDKDDAMVDLNGLLVMPGFIESHAHLLGLGQSRINLDLRGLSKALIIEKVKKQAVEQKANTWIKGRGWDQNLWEEKEFPCALDLKGVSSPVYLRRVDGHAAWFNDVALKIAGIDKNTKDPEGGVIIRDQNGNPTGVFIDNAIELVTRHVDNPSLAEQEIYLDLAMKEALSFGITSFHDAGASRKELELYQDYNQKNKLLLRIYAMIDGTDQQLVDDFLKKGPLKSDFLTIRSIKYFADGALGSRGASLLEDYEDDKGNSGLLLMEEADLVKKTKNALQHGFQVATHAIGDKANREVLNAYQEALKGHVAKEARLRVEHAQLVDPLDHYRFKELSIVASMQPIHCTSDMAWVDERIGKRLKDRAYPWQSLLEKGAVLAFGSDAPVEDINPIKGIYAAVSRKNPEEEKDSFMPEERLSLAQALNGYFLGAAFSEFSEDVKGQIAEGFFADFVVFDTDILHPTKNTFLQARPLMTVVNGQKVYER